LREPNPKWLEANRSTKTLPTVLLEKKMAAMLLISCMTRESSVETPTTLKCLRVSLLLRKKNNA
jgi:hypothetical protein